MMYHTEWSQLTDPFTVYPLPLHHAAAALIYETRWNYPRRYSAKLAGLWATAQRRRAVYVE